MFSFIPNAKNTNWLIGFGCASLMGVALFMEHQMHLEPCPLCILQRVAVIAVGAIAIVAALHNPEARGLKVYGSFMVAAAVVGGSLSARQLWLQSLPADQVPSCGPGLEYLLDVFPLTEVLQMVLTGDGSCAEVVWTFLGISIAGWTLVGFVGLVGFGLLQVLRTHAQPNQGM